MKRILTAFVMLAAAAMTLLSCETLDSLNPKKKAQTEFSTMYPDARDVEWEMKLTHFEVSFETGTPPDEKHCEAWYDLKTGAWLRTETDLLESALPQIVKDALANSEYATAVLDASDIEYVETPDGNFYQLEVTYKGIEIKLEVTEDGKISLGKVSLD